MSDMPVENRSEREQDTVACINLHTITKGEAEKLESLEHKLSVGRPHRVDVAS